MINVTYIMYVMYNDSRMYMVQCIGMYQIVSAYNQKRSRSQLLDFSASDQPSKPPLFCGEGFAPSGAPRMQLPVQQLGCHVEHDSYNRW